MAKKRVTDVDRGYKRIMHELSRIGSPSVTIGVHDKDNKPYTRGEGGPVTTAQLATFHEFGTLDRFEDKTYAGDNKGLRGVPQRSFLRKTVDENIKVYVAKIEEEVGYVIDGTRSVKVALGRVGALVTGDVQETISNGVEPRLTPAGIASKRKPSTRPLVDTGQLRMSISWEVDE